MRHERYATGWVDARGMFGSGTAKKPKYYGEEFVAISRKELLKELMPGINALFKEAYENWFKRYQGNDTDERGLPMEPKKVDDHKYETEAKDLPIETCVNMWVIKYGDGQVAAMETAEQDKLMWEIGNRLWWANRLKYNKPEDTYEIID